MTNLTFIGISLVGFVIIFVLLRFLPKVKGKKNDPLVTQKSFLASHPQSTGPKRVYRI